MKTTRRVLLTVVGLASGAAGFWFGGALERSPSAFAVGALAVAVVAAYLFGSPDRWQGRLGSALATGLAFAIGWQLAIREIDAAMADCTGRGDEVRAELDRYHGSRGSYPDELGALTLGRLPGERLLRPGLLDYERIAEGYRLECSDGFIRARADERRGFFDPQ